MLESMNELELTAKELASVLKELDLRIVFAESCTSGLIAASLGLIPGISSYLCGSAVVYREQTKVNWLGVDQAKLDEHSAESPATTAEIARKVLERTPEADVSLGITGHFGPNAPVNDGVVFVTVYQREGDSQDDDLLREVAVRRFQLETQSRSDRQRVAAMLALRLLVEVL